MTNPIDSNNDNLPSNDRSSPFDDEDDMLSDEILGQEQEPRPSAKLLFGSLVGVLCIIVLFVVLRIVS